MLAIRKESLSVSVVKTLRHSCVAKSSNLANPRTRAGAYSTSNDELTYTNGAVLYSAPFDVARAGLFV